MFFLSSSISAPKIVTFWSHLEIIRYQQTGEQFERTEQCTQMSVVHTVYTCVLQTVYTSVWGVYTCMVCMYR